MKKHSTQHFDNFYVIGIATEATHANASQKIGMLWGTFFSKDVASQITNKISEEIYAIYMDYESNYLGKYTTVIGYKVANLENIPNGLVGKTIKGGPFQKFIAKGAMPKAVSDTWQQIWKQEASINRSYQADFEVYGTISQDGANAEVDIFVGVK